MGDCGFLAQWWGAYERDALGLNATPDQIAVAKQAFYAGAEVSAGAAADPEAVLNEIMEYNQDRYRTN